MKYIIILLANSFFIIYSVLFFADHTFIPDGTGARVRNLMLLCAALYVSYNVLFIYILKRQTEQSGIIYKIASSLKHFAVNSYVFIHPFQKELFISLILAAVICIISVLLAGMPGGFLIGALQKIGLGNNIEGDNVWPAALYISFFWPLCFPVAVLTKNYFIQNGYTSYAWSALLVSGGLWIISIILSSVLLFSKRG